MQAKPSQVLIVDADEAFRKSLFKAIRRAGYEAVPAHDESEALQQMMHREFPVVIIDLWPAGRAAINLVQQIRAASPSSHLVVITPFAAEEFCAELRQLDIFECIRKPVKLGFLREVINRALSNAAD